LRKENDLEIFSLKLKEGGETIIDITNSCLSFPSHFVKGAAVELLKTIIRYSFYDNNSIRSMYVRQTKN
jgi:hypothetical protein